MRAMANNPPIECPPKAEHSRLRVPTARSAGFATAAPEVYQYDAGDGQWIELPERFRFTFAGLFLGVVSFRCMTLLRALGQPPYPVEPSLLDLLPEGVRALHICSQTITAKLPRVSRFGQGICYVPNQGTRCFIDLNGSFEAYLGKFKKKSRYKIRRELRRFTHASNASVPWREFCCAKDMAEFHTLASKVSAKTYQHRLLRAGLDPSPSFREELFRDAIGNRVRGYILFYQQTPVAYMFCRARCGDLVLEKIGFDPSFAAYSPGLVLFWFSLQRLFAGDEFRLFDLGGVASPYKAHLATGSLKIADIYCFPLNFHNLALVFMHSAVVAAANLFRSPLEILGIAQHLKTMIRHGNRRRRKG
jgi:hypothetical protein